MSQTCNIVIINSSESKLHKICSVKFEINDAVCPYVSATQRGEAAPSTSSMQSFRSLNWHTQSQWKSIIKHKKTGIAYHHRQLWTQQLLKGSDWHQPQKIQGSQESSACLVRACYHWWCWCRSSVRWSRGWTQAPRTHFRSPHLLQVRGRTMGE